MILAGVMVGCLLEAQTARASSIQVTGGSGTCGQGGGYAVSYCGTYTADTWDFFPYSPVAKGHCVTASNYGIPYGYENDPGPDTATLDGAGGVTDTVNMRANVLPEPPHAPPYLKGWYVWFDLGYYDLYGNWHGVVSSVEYCVYFTGSCFAAGTPVLTPQGSKAIEQLRAGDLVLSSPERIGDVQIGARRIQEVTRGRAKVVAVTVGGHVIQASREHPFFVRGKSWTPASSLAAGDFLRTHDGRWVQIEAVVEGRESQVYNVRVEENPTYFVGSRDWGFSLWVHDACGKPKERRALPSLVATGAARR